MTPLSLSEHSRWTLYFCRDCGWSGIDSPSHSCVFDVKDRRMGTLSNGVKVLGVEAVRVEIPSPVSHGVSLIAAERERQVAAEGWSPEHDDSHIAHQLAYAAASYLVPEDVRVGTMEGEIRLRDPWPWEGAPKFDRELRALYAGPMAVWLTNETKRASELRAARVRELVKAGALIAAEIDRIQRQEARNG